MTESEKSPTLMTGWRSIETAPKDGRRFQLLIPYDRNIFSEEECTDEGCWEPDSGRRGCFRFDGDDGPDDIQPTHWRPL